MPHIVYKAINIEDVKKIEQPIVQEIARIVDCPPEHFTSECSPTQFISHGEESAAYPFVTINWFKRPAELQDEVAKAVTKIILNLGYVDVCVYFHELNPTAYYDNGEHY